MSDTKISITIITNIVTTYREGFYDRLMKREDVLVKVYCQDSIPGMNLTSIHNKYRENIQIVKYICTKGETIGLQFLPLFKIIKESDVIFFDGNPRVLSNIFVGMLSLFFRKKKFIIWTMAHSYGANKFTEKIRLKWTSFFKNIFLYTDKEIKYLKKKGFKFNYMIGMNNGLDQDKINKEKEKWDKKSLLSWQETENLSDKLIAVSVARLTAKNKFEQVILIMPDILREYPNFRWYIIGDGPELKMLKKLALKLNVAQKIHFVGSLYDESHIAPYLLSAKFFIHPASIGLSIMHAFGYGLPVIVNDEEYMHGPEYGAFENKKTGYNFKSNNLQDLKDKIMSIIMDENHRNIMVNNCLVLANEKFNVNVMVERFVKMANTAK